MIILYLILAPLLNFILLNFFSFLFSKKQAIFITCLNIFYSLLIILYFLLRSFYFDQTIHLSLGSWVDIDFFNTSWGFLLDRVTWFMALIVTGVSCLVHTYSCNYMKEDPKLLKFLSYLSLFTFFMLVLITADNMIQLFVGWEGVGLCSYLLINFWFTRIQANKSALKAIFINRIGDTGVLLAMLILFYNLRTLNFYDLFILTPLIKNTSISFFFINLNLIEVSCFLLAVGSMAKSAQLFLHTWLPDAMEGPTPVSALIHAATMVTAGVFLIIRCSFLFESAPNTLVFISVVGALTAFFGATTALCQNDIKKIVAYSTCSQLGYMFFACGVSNYAGSLFHLINHAFFKALLFLTAGTIIHGFVNEQDIRRMGSLLNFFVLPYIFFSLGSLALAGFPFLSGFYSKDFIIESAWTNAANWSFFCYVFLILSSFFTTAYSIRLLHLVFFTKPNFYKTYITKAHETNIILGFPFFTLAAGSIFTGYLFRDMFIGSGSNFFANSVYNNYSASSYLENEFLPVFIKNTPFLIFFLAIIVITGYYCKLEVLKYSFKPLILKFYNFFNRKYFFDFIYNKIFLTPLLGLVKKNALRHLDKGLLEFIGPAGAFNFIIWNVALQKKLQRRYIFNYICYMLIGLTLLLVIIDYI